jgi:enterochelin esterase family protein
VVAGGGGSGGAATAGGSGTTSQGGSAGAGGNVGAGGAPPAGGMSGAAGAAASAGRASGGTDSGGAGAGGSASGGVAGASGAAGTSGGVAGGGTAGSSGGGGQGGQSLPDPGTEGDGDFELGPNYTAQPDLTNRGAPKGRSFQFSMPLAESEIFDGTDATLDPNKPVNTTRNISVYVPAQYQDGTPAPLLVIQDGPGELDLVKNALDNLTIAEDPARRIPPFIAIAVQNGGNDAKGSQRGLEYDTMSDRYARFIHLEVLPAVAANSAVKAAYPQLRFTEEAQGRAAIGCSSGGAAALTMGWFRPDLFSRIITYSGTFVDQQDDDAAEETAYPLGAWEYHSGRALIAASEKKALRIFLNVNEDDLGANDPESTHHNWVMANERTAAALAAKDYHYRYVFGRGAGHCDSRVRSATLADALIWVWRGYRAPQ